MTARPSESELHVHVHVHVVKYINALPLQFTTMLFVGHEFCHWKLIALYMYICILQHTEAFVWLMDLNFFYCTTLLSGWGLAQTTFRLESIGNRLYRVAPQKTGTVDFLRLCSDQQLSFFTLLDRASFLHYNNTKIIKFGGELFILWEISYGLSFSGFAINLSLIMPRNFGNRANPENDSP